MGRPRLYKDNAEKMRMWRTKQKAKSNVTKSNVTKSNTNYETLLATYLQIARNRSTSKKDIEQLGKYLLEKIQEDLN